MTGYTIPRGWFADLVDPDDENCPGPDLWQACLQTDAGCFPIDGIWFHSEADCLDFIRRDVLGKGLLP